MLSVESQQIFRRNISPPCWLILNGLRGVTSQKIDLFIRSFFRDMTGTKVAIPEIPLNMQVFFRGITYSGYDVPTYMGGSSGSKT
jgi:hypothetical protein